MDQARFRASRACSRVAVVEDNHALRQAIAGLLAHVGYEVHGFATGEALLEEENLLAKLDCVVLDIMLPGMSGLDVLRALQDSAPSVSALILTGHGDVAVAVEAMKLGAADFLEKPYSPNALLAAADKACNRSSERRESRSDSLEAATMIRSLSPRQREVLDGIILGEPNKVTAHRLDLSVRTVEMHRAQLLAKLRVRSAVEAARMALTAVGELE